MMIIHTFKDGRLVYHTQEKYIFFSPQHTGEFVNGIMCVVLRNIIANSPVCSFGHCVDVSALAAYLDFCK